MALAEKKRSSMTITETETEFEQNSISIKFKIKDFPDLAVSVSSKSFAFHQEDDVSEWKIDVFPKYVENSTEYVSVFLHASQIGKPLVVSWSCGVMSKFGIEKHRKTTEYLYKKPGGFGFSLFIEKETLLNEANGLMLDNTVTLVFEMKTREAKKFLIPERKSTYSSQMERFFVYKIFTDVTLYCDGKDIKCHKLILAENSRSFNETFQNDTRDTFIIKDFSYEILLDLISYMYTGRVENLKKNAKKLVFAAERYGMERLVRICEKSLFENLTCENCLDTLILADKQNLKELCEESLIFAKLHLKDIVKNLNWDNFVKNHAGLLNCLFKMWIEFVEPKLIKSEVLEVKCEPEIRENELNDDFENLFEKQLFTDLTFEIRGKTVKAHKSILCQRSEAFNDLILKESSERIVITDINFEPFRELLRFIYSGRVNNMKLVALDLLPAAENYRLQKLKMLCEIYLRDNLNTDNVVDTLLVANLNNCTELKKRSVSFLKCNILSIIETSKWDRFSGKNPDMVNEVLLKWINECAL